MRRALLAAAAALALAPAQASGQDHHGDAAPHAGAVSIGYAAFDPPVIDVLSGEAVHWANDSVRRHDVAAVDGSFNSGVLGGGEAFSRTFASAGEVAYYCTIHPFMRGAVNVHSLMLIAPSVPAAPFRAYPLHGRSALPPGAPITIEAEEGAGWFPVRTTTAHEDGTFAVELLPHLPAMLRAVSGAATSPPVRLLVLDRTVRATARTRRGRVRVRVRVSPAGHPGTVVLQLHLRERFGWYPVRRARLDEHGRATFALRSKRAVRARVVLTLSDGATPLAVSPELRIGR